MNHPPDNEENVTHGLQIPPWWDDLGIPMSAGNPAGGGLLCRAVDGFHDAAQKRLIFCWENFYRAARCSDGDEMHVG